MNTLHRFNFWKALNLHIFLPNKDTNFYTIPNETDIFMASMDDQRKEEDEHGKDYDDQYLNIARFKNQRNVANQNHLCLPRFLQERDVSFYLT